MNGASLRLRLSDPDAVEEFILTTRTPRRIFYLPSREPALYLRVRHRQGIWILRRPNVTRDQEVPVGYWPGDNEETAIRAAVAFKARDAEPRPAPAREPVTVAALLEAYDQERLRVMAAGAQTLRGLRQGLRAHLETNAHDLRLEDLQPSIEAIATGSKTQASRCRSYIRTFFGWAVETNRLDADPTEGLPVVVKSRPGRALPLEELAEIWRAAEVLPTPGRQAIRLLILLPIHRKDLQLDVRRLQQTADRIFWSRLPPANKILRGHPTTWRLPQLASDQVRQAFQAPRTLPSFIVYEGGRALDWIGLKRKVVEEVNRRRELEQRGAQAPWHLDDLGNSFEMMARTTMHAGADTIGRCRDQLHRFRSKDRLREALSQAGTDRACELLDQWSLLIGASTRSRASQG